MKIYLKTTNNKHKLFSLSIFKATHVPSNVLGGPGDKRYDEIKSLPSQTGNNLWTVTEYFKDYNRGKKNKDYNRGLWREGSVHERYLQGGIFNSHIGSLNKVLLSKQYKNVYWV